MDGHGEVKTKAPKGRTDRVDERRVKLLSTSSSHPDAPPSGDAHLSVRVFYCGVVLFHKDPLNKLNRL